MGPLSGESANGVRSKREERVKGVGKRTVVLKELIHLFGAAAGAPVLNHKALFFVFYIANGDKVTATVGGAVAGVVVHVEAMEAVGTVVAAG